MIPIADMAIGLGVLGLVIFFAGVWRPRRREAGLGKMIEMFTWSIHTFTPWLNVTWFQIGFAVCRKLFMPALVEVLEG